MTLHDKKQKLAKRAGLQGDPNAELNEILDDSVDWFDAYYDEYVQKGDIEDSYKAHYRRAFDDWVNFMSKTDRQPELPNDAHVEEWVDELLKRMKGNNAQKKLNLVKEVYEWMQQDPHFPHSTHYNPFVMVKNKRKRDLRGESPAEFPELDLQDVARQVEGIKHVGERAQTVLHLKTGVRSTELSNIQLRDVHLTNRDVLDHYEDLNIATHPQLKDKTNAVYIAPQDKREGNKREMPTVIPLDEETRRVLIDWLLIRPDNGDPHLFLTQKGKPLERNSLGHIWSKHWRPEYEFDEDEDKRSISPHYARHWFSSWFRVKTREPMSEPYVQYLRGDVQGADVNRTRSAFHRYVHAYYDDVEDEYREKIFKLGI